MPPHGKGFLQAKVGDGLPFQLHLAPVSHEGMVAFRGLHQPVVQLSLHLQEGEILPLGPWG